MVQAFAEVRPGRAALLRVSGLQNFGSEGYSEHNRPLDKLHMFHLARESLGVVPLGAAGRCHADIP